MLQPSERDLQRNCLEETASPVVEDDAGTPLSDFEILWRLGKVGLPSYPGGLVGRCLGLATAALVGHLNDADELAALALCNVFCNITGYSWLYGLSAGIATLSSQDWGAGSYRAVGVNLQRGFLILFLFAVLPLLLLWLISARVLEAVGQSPEVAALVGLYTAIRSPGIFFEALNSVVSRTLASIGNTRINMYAGVLTTIANLVLSFVLIPRIGFLGAPITVLACDILQAIGVCILAWRDPDFRKCWHGLTWEAWQAWGTYFKLSCPSLWLQNIEWWTWDLQSFLAGFISTEAQATQAMGPQITDLQYAMGQALGTAGTTVIGNLLGEGRPVDARRASSLLMFACVALMVCQLGIFLLFRTKLPYIFTQDDIIINKLTHLLPLTLAFSFIDGHQAALTGILTGAGKQTIAAPIIFVCYWIIAVPLGCVLAFGIWGLSPWGLQGLWTGMLVGVSCHFLAFVIYVRRLSWVKIAAKVRERTLHEQQHLEHDTSGTSLQPC